MAKTLPGVSSPLKGYRDVIKRNGDIVGSSRKLELFPQEILWYGKCPKISNTKVSEKMTYANSADPDQTAPEGAVWSGSTLFAIPLSILRNSGIKSKI